MTKNFCDICGKELDEKQKLKYTISFKFEDENKKYNELCDNCLERISNFLTDMIYRYR